MTWVSMRDRLRPAGVMVLGLMTCLVAGCSGSASRPGTVPTLTASPSSTARLSAAPSPARSPNAVAPTKILLFVLENHAESQALSSMPYLSSLATGYGRTTNYRAITHPSLPNYLALLAGSTFAISDDSEPSVHPLPGESVFDQALAKGLTAKLYAESMPINCYPTSTASYAVKHNPWTYFSGAQERANCRRDDVPMGTPTAGAFAHDIGAGSLPDIGMAVPNICNDAHDCSLATTDAWLHQWIPAIIAGPDYRAGRLALVVTFDEDDGASSNTVLTVVVSQRTIRVTARASYTHYSWLRCAEQLLHLPTLRDAATASSLCSGFGL